ncbi:non-ribosomal peptide synthetase [Saccharothrix longispora]|uniref:Amino acid adenylation domain-containing protein n=1 Tax=Saccharothrix longispora TaxID=33920 RepID=A0ABU1PQ19_9PSEU|nr:non-ribosomal peptide synthetase [Saccharothrix longispora]MDR6592728.1 amino acid adenylation domain-containing protein [Saccharothrix longispora]
MASKPDMSVDARRAQLLWRRLHGSDGASARIGRADRSRPLPLSHGQEQMWFLQQLRPGSSEYLVPVALRLTGDLDADALGRAWDQVVARHEILRTRYEMHAGAPVQVVDAAVTGLLRVERPSGRSVAELDARTEDIVGREARTPFDLALEWPCRAVLVARAADDHLLLLTLHHIACDAWSTQALLAELAEGYRAIVRGEPAALPALPVQYADFAAWQRARMSDEDRGRQLGYWTDVLSGIAPVELPTDRPRPSVRGYAGAQYDLRVEAELADRVVKLARGEGATPFVALLTAFQAVLARYTGRADVPVGTIASSRTQPELQHLVGYAVNTLVIRTRWSGDVSFRALLNHVREIVLDAFDHDAVPFAQVVDAVEPQRDLSRTPLFQVVLTMHESDGAGIALPGVTAEPYAGDGQVARCDLELQAALLPDGSITARLLYATELFDHATVERMARHFTTLLERAVAAPDAPLSDVDVLDGVERAVLTLPPRPGLGGAHTLDRFHARVAVSPGAEAVRTADGVTTFAELDARADLLARLLRARGHGPERVAGVLLDRGVDLVASFLATWKTGGAYLPIGPELPPERWAHLLGDAGADWVLTERKYADDVRALFHGEVLVVDEPVPADLPPLDPPVDLGGDALAYVIYTSGSTGRPKGVQVTHRGLANHLDQVLAEYVGQSTGGAPLFSTVASDVVVPVLYGPLLAGLPVHVLPQDLDLSELGRTLRDAAPFSFVKLTPGHLDVLAHQLSDDEIGGLAATVVPGGDVLTGHVARRWEEMLGDGRVVNEYGPTEITVGNSTCPVAEALDREVIPLGRPMPGTSMYVLDERLEPVPVGVVGEVCVGGDGVARGYVGMPATTAERFVPDPYGPPGSRLYRTGDLGKVLPDGSVDFVGRRDDQVKIRGYRVELGEVEGVLGTHEHIAQARVVLRRDGDRDPRLAAYLVAADGAPEVDAEELRDWLGRTLPEYMVPPDLVYLDRMPLTSNGKLDVAALPVPDAGAEVGYEHPRTPEEERMAAVWADVLGAERVGVRDGFFDLGGDSIRAVALVGALREAGFDVSVRDIFAERTVAALCALVAGKPELADVGGVVQPFALIGLEDRNRLPEGVVDAYPLSRNQIGMLFEMMADDQNRYHNVTSFRVFDDKPFSLTAMTRATALVTERHEALRTSLHLTGYSTPMQLVHATAKIPLAVSDASGSSPEEVQVLLREHSDRERRELFDLETPGLLRFFIHLTDDGVYWLSCTECHPILEGWGHHTLIMELLTCYEALRDGEEPPPYDPPAVRFADFVAEEMAAIASREHADYWRGVVADYAPVVPPQEWGDPDAPAGQTRQAHISWRDLEAALRARASEAGVSMKSVMLAAYAKVLSQLTDEPAFHAGLVCDARPERTGADRVYGMYLNTVPFAVDRGARTWRDLLIQVFEREVEFWPYRGFPLPEINRLTRGHGRLVTVLFNYQDFNQVESRLVGDLAGEDDSPTEFPLSISSRAGHVFVTVDPRVVTEERATAVARMFRAVLESIAAGLDGDASATYLPPGERELLPARGRTPAPGAHGQVTSAIEAFERQARLTPDATAVECGDVRLDYAELDARADRLAERLRSAGVGPGRVVGVVARRDEHLLVSLLATWKAGGAYVPLGTEQPARRWALMLDDSGAGWVLTGQADVDKVAESFFAGEAIVVDAAVDPADQRTAAREATRPDPAEPAYLVYTSGSTGRPKGVCVTHANLANYLTWAAREYSTGPGGAPLFSTPASDLVVTTLFTPLVTGRSVHVVPEDTDLSRLGARLRAAAPFGFVKLTPGHLEMLAHQLDATTARGLTTTLVVGGESLPTRTAARWADWLGDGARVINEYGPTEITVANSTQVADSEEREVVPIGVPIDGTGMHVLDEALQPVPIGVPGELCVGGLGVARGYLGRPGLTAERFVPDPYGPPGSRLYRTGDIARVLANGAVDLLGRLDGQVKIRGYRVELGEVEGVLGGHPRVAEARVVQRHTRTGEPRLVAYLVPLDETAAPEPESLSRWLAATLPDYMVPSAFVPVQALPLTPNGKLDVAALPEWDGTASTASHHVEPRTPRQRRMAAVWAEVLGVERVGLEDGFFDLGGDSILAVVLVAALAREGFEVTAREIFLAPTIARLLPEEDGGVETR